MDGTESALVALVPEAEPVVAEWRDQLDGSAADGLGAHITLLYPFADPARIAVDRIEERVRAAVAGTTPLQLTFDRVCWFADDVVWLRPTPSGPLLALVDQLQRRFVEFPRYGGVHPEVVPHVTVGAHGGLENMRRAAAAVGAQLPIDCTVRELTLLIRERRTRRWVPSVTIELTGEERPLLGPVGYVTATRRDDILRIAAEHGARNVRVFGSVARRDDILDSDLDLLVDLDSDRSLLDLAGLTEALRETLGIRVDVATEDILKPDVADAASADAVLL